MSTLGPRQPAGSDGSDAGGSDRHRTTRWVVGAAGVLVVLVVVALVVTLVRRPDTSTPGGSGGRPGTSGTPGAAHDFVVDPDGSNHGSGTADHPFRTLGHALEELQPGDTLTVNDGTYDEQLKHLVIAPGTEAAPITVRAATGAKPVLKGLLWLHDPDYWHISGLGVTWDDESSKHDHMVKFQGGKGWSMTDAEVWDAHSPAAILVTDEASRWRLARLFVHSTHDVNGNNQDQLIYISDTSGGGVVEHCLLTDSPNGRAIKIGPPDARSTRIGDVVVRYNTMYDNQGPSNIQLSRNSSDNRIYRNIFARPGDDQPNVTGYELKGDGNTVHDNIWSNDTGDIVSDTDGLEDKGGNLELDPRFTSVDKDDFRPQNPKAQAYGRYAR